MQRSVAAAIGDTAPLPGVRVRWKSQGHIGKVHDLSLCFDGQHLYVEAVFVKWDDPLIEDDSFCVDELHMLEVLT